MLTLLVQKLIRIIFFYFNDHVMRDGAGIVLPQLNLIQMEILQREKSPVKQQDDDAQFDRDFKPKGAFAFFLLLVLVGLIIWFGIYFLMLGRI